MYRRRHQNTPDLIWDYDLTQKAQAWADHLAKHHSFDHDWACNGVWGTGENLYMTTRAWGEKNVRCKAANKMWYDEVKAWDFDKCSIKPELKGKNDPQYGKRNIKYETGHFTQLVWKKTLKVGFGMAQAAGYGTVIVAKYMPGGNMQGGSCGNVMKYKPGCSMNGCGKKDEMEMKEEDPKGWFRYGTSCRVRNSHRCKIHARW